MFSKLRSGFIQSHILGTFEYVHHCFQRRNFVRKQLRSIIPSAYLIDVPFRSQFHFRPTPHPSSVRRRIKQLKDYISVTSDWISYALIDDITDAFGPLIQSIEYEVDSIDELVLILKDSTEQSDMLRRIGTCRKKVMGLLRLMGNKADVVKGLAKRCNENWQVAPTSDIVRMFHLYALTRLNSLRIPGSLSIRYPSKFTHFWLRLRD